MCRHIHVVKKWGLKSIKLAGNKNGALLDWKTFILIHKWSLNRRTCFLSQALFESIEVGLSVFLDDLHLLDELLLRLLAKDVVLFTGLVENLLHVLPFLCQLLQHQHLLGLQQGGWQKVWSHLNGGNGSSGRSWKPKNKFIRRKQKKDCPQDYLSFLTVFTPLRHKINTIYLWSSCSSKRKLATPEVSTHALI